MTDKLKPSYITDLQWKMLYEIKTKVSNLQAQPACKILASDLELWIYNADPRQRGDSKPRPSASVEALSASEKLKNLDNELQKMSSEDFTFKKTVHGEGVVSVERVSVEAGVGEVFNILEFIANGGEECLMDAIIEAKRALKILRGNKAALQNPPQVTDEKRKAALDWFQSANGMISATDNYKTVVAALQQPDKTVEKCSDCGSEMIEVCHGLKKLAGLPCAAAETLKGVRHAILETGDLSIAVSALNALIEKETT